MAFQAISALPDGGPVYFETDLTRWIVEPWNAFSSLTFLIPALYFLWLLRHDYHRHKFLVYWCIPLLALGGIGSTLFHGLRQHLVFMLLDIIPIAFLTLSLGYYFLQRLLHRWWLSILIILGSFAIRLPFHSLFEGHTAINIGYFITGLTIFIPAIFYLWKNSWKGTGLLALTALFLSLALLFRYTDTLPNQLLPMGTHWLWHLSTSTACFFLGFYLINDQPAPPGDQPLESTET